MGGEGDVPIHETSPSLASVILAANCPRASVPSFPLIEAVLVIHSMNRRSTFSIMVDLLRIDIGKIPNLSLY